MINIVRLLGSIRLTIAGIFTMGVGVLLNLYFPDNQYILIYFPLFILSINLLAAILTKPEMRRQRALLVFHLCLLGLLLLAMLGRLVHFKGRIELTEGEVLSAADLVTVNKGLWHRQGLSEARIEQGPIRVSYAPELYRQETLSQLQVSSVGNDQELRIIDDNHPLVVDGYRFYITSNKGFSVLLLWQEEAAEPVLGAINFPSFPVLDWKQIQYWETPAGESLTFRLDIGTATNETENWILTSDVAAPVLEVARDQSEKILLQQGDSLLLRGGKLEFYQLRMWMGYHVFYDPTLRWLFAFSLIGVLAMSRHLYARVMLDSSRLADLADVKEGA